jgi:chemotaxis response regulator CheB
MLQPDLAGVRVLIVGARGYAAAMLRTVLNASGISRIDVVENPRRALDLLCMENIDVVLIAEHV